MGYILGLGDRHPSNLMLDRLTGKILHIDFGDCFEVAMHRDKFPEKIPFRLTRMLVNAMEVSGIEGNFRSTCEAVMGMLRALLAEMMTVMYQAEGVGLAAPQVGLRRQIFVYNPTGDRKIFFEQHAVHVTVDLQIAPALLCIKLWHKQPLCKRHHHRIRENHRTVRREGCH